MKKKIDIEKLLQWTFREEMPKGRPVTATAWDAIMSYSQLGARIDVSHQGSSGLGFVPGSPHEDAERVAVAVAAHDESASFATRADVAALFADMSGMAEHFTDAAMATRINPRALILSHAAMGSRPKWKFEPPTPHQERATFRDEVGALRDRPRVIGLDACGDVVDVFPNRGRKAMKFGLYDLDYQPRSPLIWSDPSPLHVAECRAEYIAWHAGLVSLASSLRDALREYQPELPIARQMPWITGEEARSRVLPLSGFDPSILSGKLPLQPKRHAPLPPLESDIERHSRLASRTRPDRQPAESEPMAGIT